jgi:rhodanese-related sulfurtransferase
MPDASAKRIPVPQLDRVVQDLEASGARTCTSSVVVFEMEDLNVCYRTAFAFTALAITAAYSVADEHTKDTPADVKKAIENKSAILIDVREQSEWDEGHLKDARLVPLSKLKKDEAKALIKDLPKDMVIYCHCKSGIRSLDAAEILQKLGFRVKPLKPGYKDLLDAGFPKADK